MSFFLVQDFVYSNEWVAEEWLFFTFFKLKNQLFAYEKKIGLSERELLKYHEAANFRVCREPYQ